MRKSLRVQRLVLTLLLFSTVIPNGVAQTAAQSQQTLKQYVLQLQSHPDDRELREKIIKLALTLKPPPAIPEEWERFMARGVAAMKEAKDTKDFKEAAEEFEKATLAAPWLANAYYNLGFAKSKVGDYGAAASSLKLYLLAAPDAPDAKEVKSLMYEMEFKAEKAAKGKQEQDVAARREMERQQQEAAAAGKDLEFIRSKGLDGAIYVLHYEDYNFDRDIFIYIRGNEGVREGVMVRSRLKEFSNLVGIRELLGRGRIKGRQIIIPNGTFAPGGSQYGKRDLVGTISEDGKTITTESWGAAGAHSVDTYERER